MSSKPKRRHVLRRTWPQRSPTWSRSATCIHTERKGSGHDLTIPSPGQVSITWISFQIIFCNLSVTFQVLEAARWAGGQRRVVLVDGRLWAFAVGCVWEKARGSYDAHCCASRLRLQPLGSKILQHINKHVMFCVTRHRVWWHVRTGLTSLHPCEGSSW